MKANKKEIKSIDKYYKMTPQDGGYRIDELKLTTFSDGTTEHVITVVAQPDLYAYANARIQQFVDGRK